MLCFSVWKCVCYQNAVLFEGDYYSLSLQRLRLSVICIYLFQDPCVETVSMMLFKSLAFKGWETIKALPYGVGSKLLKKDGHVAFV